jgi:hypothetical protein
MVAERDMVSAGMAPCDNGHGWNDDELAALRRLSRLVSRRRGAQSWHMGATDAGEPQFYLVGPDPDQPCVACVSRVGSGYVLEDGNGHVLAEEARVAELITRASAAFPVRRRVPLSARAFLAVCAWRAFVDQKMAAFEESLDVLARVAPHVAGLA